MQRRLFCGGLATTFCVRQLASSLWAREMGAALKGCLLCCIANRKCLVAPARRTEEMQGKLNEDALKSGQEKIQCLDVRQQTNLCCTQTSVWPVSQITITKGLRRDPHHHHSMRRHRRGERAGEISQVLVLPKITHPSGLMSCIADLRPINFDRLGGLASIEQDDCAAAIG